MKSWLKALDRILRGEATTVESLKSGLAEVPLAGMTALIILLGAIYGMGMGTFALFKEGGPSVAQFVASAVKIPALFLLTVVITFPSLYVFNALVGSRLTLASVLRLLVAGLAVTLAVLASFGPIVAFFSVSTTSYPFMVLLNVAMCAVGGMLGLSFLRQTLHRFTVVAGPLPTTPPLLPQAPAKPGALDPVGGKVLRPDVQSVFRWWMVLFALVGSQMGWVLRPFIGQPGMPFTFFRTRESNFFAAVWENLLALFQ
jgi:hypothetical protein